MTQALSTSNWQNTKSWRYGFKRTSAFLVLGLMVLWSGMAHAALAPDSFSNLAKKVSPSVVWIATTQELNNKAPEMPFAFPEGSPFEKFFRQFRNGPDHKGRPRLARGLGSGFIVDPSGYIVTNNHVIDHATSVKVKLANEEEYDAQVIGKDGLTDLALLKIEADVQLPAVPFGNSDKADVGDWVMAVGNPFGLGGTVTTGIVSARGRNIQAGPYDDFLQIDAPINKGNSGGPLFNLDGEVIGVNTAIFSPNGGSVGIGFAIPSNLVKPIVAQIREKGSVERGWLGVQIQDVSPEIADAMGLKEPAGALVSDVIAGSPAESAGLASGDVVLGVGNAIVEDPRDLARLVAQRPVGDEAQFTVWRNGEEISLLATLGKRPESEQLASRSNAVPESGVYHSAALGADLAALTGDRRARMDIPGDLNGVVIVDVQDGPALDQGLRQGDVIRKVDQRQVSSPQEVDSLVREAAKGGEKAVLLLVNRHGRDIFVGLKPGMA